MKSLDEGFQDSYFDDPSSELSDVAKKSKIVLLTGILISTLALGTTLATNVNLGSSDPLEFGQGVQLLAACSGSTPITVTPTREFVNRAGAGDYFISGFKVTNVPQSCANKDFRFTTYESSTSSVLALFNDGRTNVTVNFNGLDFVAKGSSSCNYAITSVSSSAFNVIITNPVETASAFSRLTIESGSDFYETGTIASGNQGISLNGCTSLNGNQGVAPAIASIPDTATAGSLISVYGTGFTSDAIVKFWRNQTAVPISVTSTQIIVMVPGGATTGKILVTTSNGQAASSTTLTILP